jgi:uncharacterized Zn finger protein (UPF0148 family)
MHLATCPTCGTTVPLDFIPTAGLVWCPTCEKTFSPSGMSQPDQDEMEGEIPEDNGQVEDG